MMRNRLFLVSCYFTQQQRSLVFAATFLPIPMHSEKQQHARCRAEWIDGVLMLYMRVLLNYRIRRCCPWLFQWDSIPVLNKKIAHGQLLIYWVLLQQIVFV